MTALAGLGTMPRGRSELVVPALIVAAWLVILGTQVAGFAPALHHHALIEGGPALWVAIPVFLVSWQVMVVAMMLPASLPAIQALGAAPTSTARTPRARATFIAAFAMVWAAFGLAAFLGDVAVHRIVDTTPWLADRPWLIEAGVLALAGAYQFTPAKRRSLEACRHAADLVPAGVIPTADAARSGLGHGLVCFGSSWALMLLMFAEGVGSLWWMVALTVVMAYEATGRNGVRVASAVGVVLLLFAISVMGAPAAGSL